MIKQILIPDIGDFEKVEIIEVLVKPGDRIKKDDSLITLESDKSSVEVPATEEGTIEKLNVKVGDKVSKGDLILSLTSTSTSENEDIKSKIPPVTEKIIQQAEATLEEEEKKEDKEEEKVDTKKIEKKK